MNKFNIFIIVIKIGLLLLLLLAFKQTLLPVCQIFLLR